MDQSVGVPQFVEAFLVYPLVEDGGIPIQSVKFLPQTRQGNQRGGSSQLGFSEDEGEDRDAQVLVDDPSILTASEGTSSRMVFSIFVE